MTPRFPLAAWAGCLPAVALVLSGCSTLDPQAGHESVRQRIQERSGQTFTPSSEPSTTGPVELDNADAAVRLALGNTPRVHGILATMDAAEARAVQGSLLRNPFLHATFLYPRDGQGKTIDAGLSWDLLGLISLGPRRAAADQARSLARQTAVSDILGLAARSRAAWYAHLADREGIELLTVQAEAADLNAELGERLEQAGNLPPLGMASAQATRLDVRYALEDARLAAQTSLERLASLLGIDEPARLKLPARLPRLPTSDPPAPDPAALAAFDLRLASLTADLERARNQAGAVRRTGWTDGLELGWSWERETSGEWKDGPSVGVALPFFDTGAARRAAARADVARLEASVAELKLALARETREAFSRMQRARDRVENLRERLLPLLSDARDEALLQYNAMQKSPFHLLDLKQRELVAVRQLVQGLADYWQARTALESLKLGVSLVLEETPRAPQTGPVATQTGGH